MSAIDNLLKLDHIIWVKLNNEWHFRLLDEIMPIMRNQYTWAPVYAFLLFFSIWKFGKKGLFWSLAYFISFALCDYISAGIIKEAVMRLRPCNDPINSLHMRLLVECGSGYSFPSSHATNHFGMSFFLYFTLGSFYKWIKPIVILWAFLVAYAQVYVGVHYPLDVCTGAILGSIIGYFMAKIFNKFISLKNYTN
jgi:undecaprenyl-diphosphatase